MPSQSEPVSPARSSVHRASGAERNAEIAGKLAEAADLLSLQGAEPFRAAAYRRAAEAVEGLESDVADLVADGGGAALDAIPGIGPSIAAAILEMLGGRRWRFLDQLRAATSPEKLFCAIPGIGPDLAARLHQVTRADTLEALEIAAHEGRLALVPGIGPRRAALIKLSLARMLGRVRPRPPVQSEEEPGVAMLLDIDLLYRTEAAAGALPKIAPKRFNPSHESWLPVLRDRFGAWEVRALYSNTARAHALGRVEDWVLIFCRKPGRDEMQWTVVTEKRGPLAGRRVVRGREADCRRHYGIGREAGERRD